MSLGMLLPDITGSKDIMFYIQWAGMRFGLPAENAAIKRGIHPARWTWSNIENMRKQLKRLGISYDWDRELATCDPTYYKWTEWFFLLLYKRGLAYRGRAKVNWCPTCKTVTANEEVIDGKCWRCHQPVEERYLEQWFFKITDYAERLLNDLDRLPGWPEHVKTMQRNWIGKSYGAEIDFKVEGEDTVITVFTTRPDTIYGATFMLLAPEHPIVKELVAGTTYEKDAVQFVEDILKEDKVSRMAEDNEKKGFFIGKYTINPLTGYRMPIYVANYILMDYGTGAIMAVPAHDERDFAFARKYNQEIIVVIQPEGETLNPDTMADAYSGSGFLVNSDRFNGLDNEEAKEKITEHLAAMGIGKNQLTID